jgi:hypothetical protein
MSANTSLVVASMDRTNHLVESLYTWLDVKEISEFVVVDYSSRIPLTEHTSIKKWIDEKKIKLIRVNGEKYFHRSKSRNITFDFATQEKILKIDADYKNIDSSWITHLNNQFLQDKTRFFLHGMWQFDAALTGFLYMFKKDFVGFRETLEGWGCEDTDLYDRIQKNNKNLIRLIFFDITKYIKHIDHGDEQRTINEKFKNKYQSARISKRLCKNDERMIIAKRQKYKTTIYSENYFEVEFI